MRFWMCALAGIAVASAWQLTRDPSGGRSPSHAVGGWHCKIENSSAHITQSISLDADGSFVKDISIDFYREGVFVVMKRREAGEWSTNGKVLALKMTSQKYTEMKTNGDPQPLSAGEGFLKPDRIGKTEPFPIITLNERVLSYSTSAGLARCSRDDEKPNIDRAA